MIAGTKAQTIQGTHPVCCLYVAEGKNCDAEMARQPALVRASRTEMARQEFRVRIELMEIHEVSERYPHIRSTTSKSTRRVMTPRAGREEKTRKKAGAKFINLPHLPVKTPLLKVLDLVIACNSG